MENEIFEASYLYQICNSKAIEIYRNQHADLLRYLFAEDSLKIKEHGISFQATFFTEFFDKKIYFLVLHKLATFNYQTVFTSDVIQ